MLMVESRHEDFDDLGRPPPVLYKFRSMLTEQDRRFAREIVVDSKLYFPTALQFNDPFEAAPAIAVDLRPDVLKRHLTAMIARQMPQADRARRRQVLADMLRQPRPTILRQAEEASRSTLAEIGFCSMAGNCDNILMWSHYAAAHTGICLGFQTEPFELNVPMCRAYPVRYEPERPAHDPLSGMKPRRMFDLLLTKASFWSYEEEYRLIRRSPLEGPGHEPFPSDRLVSITFGMRTPPEVMALVHEWIRERRLDVPLFQAQPDPALFALRVKPL